MRGRRKSQSFAELETINKGTAANSTPFHTMKVVNCMTDSNCNRRVRIERRRAQSCLRKERVGEAHYEMGGELVADIQ